MPAKRVSLANAGKKLVGPPEGYNKKKELQVKQWLKGAAPAPETAAPSIEPEVRRNQADFCQLSQVERTNATMQ